MYSVNSSFKFLDLESPSFANKPELLASMIIEVNKNKTFVLII